MQRSGSTLGGTGVHSRGACDRFGTHGYPPLPVPRYPRVTPAFCLSHVRRQPKRENRERDQDHEADQIGGDKGQNSNENGRKANFLHYALDDKNVHADRRVNAILAMETQYNAHLSVMRRDQYHWKLMQPEGQLIDWPLLCTWVAQSRFGKAFGPQEIPILNADADFIRWLGAEIVAAAAESAHAAERPAMARPNQNSILLMAFFSTESG